MKFCRFRHVSTRSVLLVAGLLGINTPLQAQAVFRAWIQLYEPSQIGWLENENRISDLCSDPSTLQGCYAEVLGPLVHIYDLHRGPEGSSARVGELIVVATPGRGLSSHFRRNGSRETAAFTPDLHLQDWGYGPYFHQTLTDQNGDWFQLPPGPWAESVWFRREAESSESAVVQVTAGDIIEMNGSGWYVVVTEADALLLRPEQPGDIWCQEGKAPPITPVEPERFPRTELRDSRGHLVFTPKYLKGC